MKIKQKALTVGVAFLATSAIFASTNQYLVDQDCNNTQGNPSTQIIPNQPTSGGGCTGGYFGSVTTVKTSYTCNDNCAGCDEVNGTWYDIDGGTACNCMQGAVDGTSDVTAIATTLAGTYCYQLSGSGSAGGNVSVGASAASTGILKTFGGNASGNLSINAGANITGQAGQYVSVPFSYSYTQYIGAQPNCNKGLGN